MSNPVSPCKANDNIIQCMSPARDIGATQLEVTHNGGAEYTSSGTLFSYWPSSEILSVDPVSGPIAGGTLVTVVGHGLRDTTRCRFGNEVVDGQHYAGVDSVYCGQADQAGFVKWNRGYTVDEPYAEVWRCLFNLPNSSIVCRPRERSD